MYYISTVNSGLGLSEESKMYIIDNYATMTYRQIGNVIGLTDKQVEGWVRNHIKDREKKIRSFNSDFFRKIDTPSKAYWIGLLYADGWISFGKASGSGGAHYEMGIQLNRSDRYILELLNNDLGGVHKIKDETKIVTICDNKNETISSLSTLRVYSKDIVMDLHKNGIDYNKTNTGVFPMVEDRFFADFLRGYIDGDGCIYEMKRGILCVNITSCTSGVLNYINNQANKLYGVRTNIYSENSRKHRIMWYRKSDVETLLKEIYYDTGDYMLYRKYNTYAQFYGLSA